MGIKLSEQDLKELESAMECLFNDGLNDGDLGYKHRVIQIELIQDMVKQIQKLSK